MYGVYKPDTSVPGQYNLDPDSYYIGPDDYLLEDGDYVMWVMGQLHAYSQFFPDIINRVVDGGADDAGAEDEEPNFVGGIGGASFDD
jgi:hypothetical protein